LRKVGSTEIGIGVDVRVHGRHQRPARASLIAEGSVSAKICITA
jgi:hypothetical protein